MLVAKATERILLYDYWQRGDEAIDDPDHITERDHGADPQPYAGHPGVGDEDEWLGPATSVDTARAMRISCPSEWLSVASAS